MAFEKKGQAEPAGCLHDRANRTELAAGGEEVGLRKEEENRNKRVI